MTLFAIGGSTIEATLNAVQTGLVGTLRVSIIDTPDGPVLYGPSTDNIFENPPGSTIYSWSGTAPPSIGQYTIVWDDGTDEGVLGVEDLIVTRDLPFAECNVDLCTVDDVKQELEITSDTSRDDVIASIITGVSRTIQTMTERQFRCQYQPEPGGTVDYSFSVRPGSFLVDLAPYDLHSTVATTITIHPNQPEEFVLSDTHWVAEPIGAYWSFMSVRISNDVTNLHNSEFTRDFGYTIVRIASPSWGFASIPEDVKRAAIISVAANLDRRLDAYSFAAGNELVDMDAGVQPARQMAFSIPMAAMVLLNPYRRNVGAF
jgi:hypothetical protein